ncbi:Nucleolar protein 16 [Clydaea vesicula]|uniref:Nucleolar protein 16 n=1 Tax=Clydaea vesicula TaxID=447962 RepID=A0AAD5TVG1_9FUNG|nr:Nucleolar protein 16 [Clydaea vesicula]KAJ3379270.1 Nucleolar protein 16 [Lobulomyces angularis]
MGKSRSAHKKSNTKTSRRQKNRKNVSFSQAHPLVKENWDKKLTVKQNYEKLGLTTSLNGKAGGVELTVEQLELIKKNNNDNETNNLSKLAIKKGAVGLRTLEGNEEVLKEVEEGEDVHSEFIEDNVVVDVRGLGVGKRIGQKKNNVEVKESNTPIIDKMIIESQSEVKRKRHVSEQELKFLVDLKKKYNSDYFKMSRDRKLNPFLINESSLKKKFKLLEEDISDGLIKIE